MADDENTYDVGDPVDLQATFSSGDQDAVTFKVKSPDGTVSTYTGAGAGVTSEDLGEDGFRYTKRVVVDQEGRWYWRVEATGAGAAAGDRSLYVRDSVFV